MRCEWRPVTNSDEDAYCGKYKRGTTPADLPRRRKSDPMESDYSRMRKADPLVALLKKFSEGERLIKIRISDTGVGIKKEI